MSARRRPARSPRRSPVFQPWIGPLLLLLVVGSVAVPVAAHPPPTWRGPPLSPGAPASGCGNQTPLSFHVRPTPALGPNDTVDGNIPLTVGWKFLASGGAAPYNFSAMLPNGTTIYGANASYTFRIAGSYQVDFTVRSGSPVCQSAGNGFIINAYGSGGSDPVRVHLSTTSGPAPLTVHASLTVLGGLTNPAVEWLAPGPVTWGGLNHTAVFYQAGLITFGLCVYYSNATNATIQSPYWCGHSAWINVTTGFVLANLSADPTTGVSPLNATVWVNFTDPSRLPNGTVAEVGVGVPDGGTDVYFTRNNGTPTSAPGSSGYGAQLATTANATFYAVLTNPYDVAQTAFIDLDLLLNASSSDQVLIFQQILRLEVNGLSSSPPPPFPVLSLTATPSSGTGSLAAQVDVGAQGGSSPYRLNLSLWGPVGPNGSEPIQLVQLRSNWSGAALLVNLSLNQTGNYSVLAQLVDASAGTAVASAVLTVASASAPVLPPPLRATASSEGKGGGPGRTVTFRTTIVGGAPPYSVQWSFGDGTVGSSANGGSIDHSYTAPGTYLPSLRVTDSLGQTVHPVLAPVVVVATGDVGTAAPPSPAFPMEVGLPWIAAGAIGGGAVLGINLAVRRGRLRREGDALLADAPELEGDPGAAPDT